ncbi:ESPR-type extended signal peptide-containing protein [Haemophilus sp. oral taxon 036]|uniref:ESPR-type extended signal peptide-containing protein n=1 Tax=Haemophilus sp. oral taxon 036 TaxID=712310 RepID=UPI000D036C85|nr:ESPR-type extended signal peptide-containing protein [Haemophilus sp. oral taxon 036]AVM60527.1 hypothetical protein C3V42_07830 [Haemophilus sp. oral taxon 036]
MNQIFRVIWNHATQSWVAVSELASAKGKTKSKTISKLAALSLIAGTALSMDAIAASSTITAVSKTNGNLAILTNNQDSINARTTGEATPKNVIYIGNGRVPSSIGDEFVAIGNDMNGNSSGNAGDTLIGNRVRSGGGGQDSFGTAVGYAAQVSGPSVSIGVGTSSDIGSDRGWEAVKYSGIAIGAFSRVSGSANGGVAMGAISFADQTGSVAIGQLSGAASLIYDREVAGSGGGGKVYKTNEATGGNLVSIGAEAGARSTSSVAIGTQATTSKGNDSIAMGTNSAAIKDNSIAIGHAAIAGGHTQADIDALNKKKIFLEAEKVKADERLLDKTAAAEANPTAENKFQLSAAKAAVERLDLAIRRIDADLQRLSAENVDTTNAIAIGNQAKATNQSALAQGDRATATGKRSIAQGTQANSTGEDAIAQGTETKATGSYAIAQGRKAEATANFTIAQGNSANASAQFAMALGNQAKANIEHGVALGSSSETTVAKGVTGFNPTAQGTSDIRANAYAPLSGNSLTSTLAGVSVGSATNTRQINHVAAGTADDDAVNVAQLRSVNLKIAGNTNGETESAKSGDMRNTATSKADVLLDSQTLKVVSSNTDVLTTDATNNTITITPKTKKVEVEEDKNHADAGKAKVPTTNGLVTATDLADTLNNMYWKIEADKNAKGKVSGKSTEAVKAGDKVRLIAGEGVKIEQNGRDFTFSVKNIVQRTNADGSSSFFRAGPNMEVELKGEGKDQHIEYKLSPDITINSVTTNGGAKLEGTTLSGLSHHLVPTTPNETAGTKPAAAAGDQLNQAATVNDVLNAGWNLKENGKNVDFVKPYDNVNFVHGANTKVSVKTDDHLTSNIQVNVTGLPIAFTDKDGTPVVKVGDKYFKADKDGNPTNIEVTPSADAPLSTNLVNPNVSNTNASPNAQTTTPTQLGNVAAGAKTFDAPKDASGNPLKLANDGKWYPANKVGPNGKPMEDATPVASPITANNPTAGLVDFANSKPNNAATVGDLQNLGWVVSANENGYTDQVRNTNKVDFQGKNGISVTGETRPDGTRQITVSIAKGEITNVVDIVDKDGKPVKKAYRNEAGDLFELDENGKPDTSKPIIVDTDAGQKVSNPGDAVVTGNAVATAIQKSGWNIGKATADDVTDSSGIPAKFSKASKVHDKVNPDDDVKFVDGNNTVVKMVTVDSKNEDGTKKATTFVKVDVSGMPVQYTTADGKPAIKVGDKFYPVDENGDPITKNADGSSADPLDPADIITNLINPAAKPDEKGNTTTLGNIKNNLPTVDDANKTAADKNGKPLVGKDNKAAPITAEEAANIANSTSGNNAATVSDVLNAGWNLQNNGEARDFVKPYDTVNFVDGKGTKVVVETSNGTTSNVKFDIDTGSITNNADGSVQGPVTQEMQNALKDAEDALNSLPPNAPDAVRKAAKQAFDDAKNNIENVKNKVATAEDVANAINKSGFTLTTSANGGEKISGTPEVINPGKKVEMVAGKNMTVKQESNGKVTYATASNVTFDSVQFGNNGPKITNNGGNINVGTATGAPTKITGVAPGEISATSKDAVNGSQLYAMGNKLQGQINKLGNRMNAGMATSAAMANLLQPHKPGQSVATAGIGQHKNQSAVAVGYSRISDNGKYGVRFSMGANTQGEVTGGAAVGYFW